MSHPSSLEIFCATWNVNGKKVSEDLSPWLIPDTGKPDLYVIGFQEFDLTRESFAAVDEERFRKWDEEILKVLSKVGDYVQVARQQLVGILIILYAKKDLAPLFEDLDSDMIGTGYHGTYGNKGGVAVRFRFGNDTFCFVNSHLNAHVHNVERRNNDYKSICARLVFSPLQKRGTNRPQDSKSLPEGFVVSDDRAEESSNEVPNMEPKELEDGDLTIFDHNHVFWLGDLNYRIDLEREDLMDKIEKKDWEPLSKADQLKREIANKTAFSDFAEHELNFHPTYKYDSGTDNYDSSRKRRLPAYCDRILWRQSQHIHAISYKGHLELKVSDHKPVSSIVRVALQPVEPPAKQTFTEPTPSSSPSPSPAAPLTPPTPTPPAPRSAKPSPQPQPQQPFFQSPGFFVALAVVAGFVLYFALQ